MELIAFRNLWEAHGLVCARYVSIQRQIVSGAKCARDRDSRDDQPSREKRRLYGDTNVEIVIVPCPRDTCCKTGSSWPVKDEWYNVQSPRFYRRRRRPRQRTLPTFSPRCYGGSWSAYEISTRFTSILWNFIHSLVFRTLILSFRLEILENRGCCIYLVQAYSFMIIENDVSRSPKLFASS